jgi:RNA recognition motif-containing protein
VVQGNKKTVIVEDLDVSINVIVLTRHFSSAGSIAKVDILCDPITSRPTGTAFVTFKTTTASDFALATMKDTKIFGRPCRVSPSVPVATPMAATAC